MIVMISFRPTPKILGETVGEQLDNGNEFVVVRDAGFMHNSDIRQFAREATEQLGQLSLSGSGVDQTDVWSLDEAKSKPSRVDYHTDNPHYPSPERYVGFWCVSSANDGANVLLNSADFLEELHKNDKELAELVVKKPVEFRYGDTQYTGTIFSPEDGQLRLGRYATHEDDKLLIERVSAIIDREGSATTRKIQLSPGDVMFFNNHKLLHGREPYRRERSSTPRLMLRTRVI